MTKPNEISEIWLTEDWQMLATSPANPLPSDTRFIRLTPELEGLIEACNTWQAYPVENVPFGIWEERRDKLVAAVEVYAKTQEPKP